MSSSGPLIIRQAKVGDGEALYRMICELAVFEEGQDKVTMTAEQLDRDLTVDQPLFIAYIAETEGKVVGFVNFSVGYSSWVGPRINLDDLYVKPPYRHQGIGRVLLDRVFQHAKSQGIKWVEWRALDWNKPAAGFYHRIGASPLEGWTLWRYETNQR